MPCFVHCPVLCIFVVGSVITCTRPWRVVCHALCTVLEECVLLCVLSLESVSCSVHCPCWMCHDVFTLSVYDMTCTVHTVIVGLVMKLYPKMTYNKPEVSVMLLSMTTLVIFHFGRCKLHTTNNSMKGELVNIIILLN